MAFKIKEIIVYDNCRGSMVHREKVSIEMAKRSDLELYRERLRLEYYDRVPACGEQEPDPNIYFVYQII